MLIKQFVNQTRPDILLGLIWKKKLACKELTLTLFSKKKMKFEKNTFILTYN